MAISPYFADRPAAALAMIGITAAVAIAMLAAWIGFATGAPDRAAATDVRPRVDADVEIPGEPIQPIPLDLAIDLRTAELGRRLFNDPRLSHRGTISCASCHAAEHDFAGDAPATEEPPRRNATLDVPTIRNSWFSIAQFWDGRAATLEAQVDFPLQSPDEMASSWPEVIGRLRADPDYLAAARAIGKEPLSPELVRASIAEYERSVVSSGSRFDAFLRGQGDALSADEKAGYALFKQYGCSACHQGVAVGGNLFQRLGLFGDYFHDRGGPITRADLGRYNVTGDESDRYVFKVPSLREAALLPPYFHDGSVATLEAAIATMARYQLGRKIPADDIRLIAAFLRSLPGTTAEARP
ncbi:MAG TPA: cytochrome c peroxidase [Stellaceae bacterium]|jgi:cytochrome c peroxidase|nr:cytochrome c peroxidase [Stellaceae bacterium]